MVSFSRFFGVVALATSVAAQSQTLYFSTAPTSADPGAPQDIEYVAPDMSSPVTITLMQGSTTDLQSLYVLTDSAVDGSWSWTPASNLPSNTNYALEIQQGSETNWWGPIVVNASNAIPVASTTTLNPTSIPTTVIRPASNTTVPPPPPFQGSGIRNSVASFSGILALFGAFVLFL